ncbi:MAG: Gfo/Idh/MocA family oxidoreductase [Thermoanaerobaculia bacterium]
MNGILSPVRIAVIGCGYWGPNLIRNFSFAQEFSLVAACDLDSERLDFVKRQFSIEKVTTDARAIIEDPSIEAVAISTPVSTHAALARDALLSGKHVLVEKPLANSARECEELARIAERTGRVLLVDHTFLYTGTVEKIRDLIDRGELGRLYYFDSVRVNLGLFQHDCNVLWDLAPHDLSIMLYLIEERPFEIIAVGATPVDPTSHSYESVAYLMARFRSGLIAHVHVNWLAPVKIRLTMIGGSRKMVVWDDVEPDTKLRIYDRGVDAAPTAEAIYRTLVQYRTGDMYAPKIEKAEALRKECLHFADCIRNDATPRSDAKFGRDVVVILEAAQKSLQRGGAVVRLHFAEDHE